MKDLHEEYELKRIGATPTPNSGRGKIKKGDGLLAHGAGTFTIDVKEYDESYGLSVDNWRKLCTDTVQNGSTDGLFKVVLGKDPNKTRLVVMSEQLFLQLFEDWWKYNDLYNS